MEDILRNFATVLFDYRKDGEISYQGDVVLELIEQGEIDSFADLLEKDYREEVLNIYESLDYETVTNIKIVDEDRGRGLSLKINEVEYRYVSDKFSIIELASKFKSIYDVSAKDAMVWLKENAVNYWHERPYETRDVKRSLEDKIQEWLEKFKKEENIKASIVNEGKGLMIAVFEDEDGNIHKENPVIGEVVESLSEYTDLTESWAFEKDDDINVWYNSFVIEEGFDEIEDTEDFNNKMESKMNEVIDELDDDELFKSGKYIDFELTDEDNVDIEFELELSDEDVNEDNLEEFMESINFIDTIIDKVSEVVDDYEGVFLKFADLDLELDGGTVEVTVEFSMESDVEERNILEKLYSIPTQSIHPDDLVSTIKAGKLLNTYDGEDLMDRLISKDFLKKDKWDYEKIEVYPSETVGRVILVFISDMYGYDMEEPVSIDVSRMSDNLLSVLDIKDKVKKI